MADVKAIITDLDGTILPCRGVISPETINVLHQSGTQGIIRIIATGRNLYAAMKALPQDFPLDYLIFSSGAGIMGWRDKQILDARSLSCKETRKIAGYLWNYNINFTVQREIPDNHHFYYTDIYPLHADYQQRIATYKEFGTPISCPEDIRSGATQLIMILDTLQVKQIRQIRSDLEQYSVIRSTSPIDNRAIWLEIFPQGINKGTACLQLLNQLQINPADCAGIGNDYNDVDFLDICGQSFLVANAPLRLKPHYKTVAKDQDNGFSEFIRLIKKEA